MVLLNHAWKVFRHDGFGDEIFKERQRERERERERVRDTHSRHQRTKRKDKKKGQNRRTKTVDKNDRPTGNNPVTPAF
jgi:hypothetical protein